VLEHPEYVVKTAEGKPRIAPRVLSEYHMLDWTRADFRARVLKQLAHMVSPKGLNADGVKIAGHKFLPEPSDTVADRSYGRGDGYLLRVLQEISATLKKARADAPIYLPCANPLFAPYFDIVRLGNTSEVNHEFYVQRAEVASYLMPDKPIDTDDWAAFAKMIGGPTFMKAVTGVPDIFGALYRGDGRWRGNGAPGGAPMTITKEQYRIIAAAWKVYGFSVGADRSSLRVDFDRLEFSTTAKVGPKARTYQGGNILAVSNGNSIYLTGLQDTTAIIDLPARFKVAKVTRLLHSGKAEAVPFTKCLRNKVLFPLLSCRDETLYYQVKRKAQWRPVARMERRGPGSRRSNVP